jgi:hypothetical protein
MALLPKGSLWTSNNPARCSNCGGGEEPQVPGRHQSPVRPAQPLLGSSVQPLNILSQTRGGLSSGHRPRLPTSTPLLVSVPKRRWDLIDHVGNARGTCTESAVGGRIDPVGGASAAKSCNNTSECFSQTVINPADLPESLPDCSQVLI